MKLEFCITIEPFVILLIVCAAVGLYALRRGYDWSRQQMEVKAKQGQRI